jgi:type IV secretory pathway VirB3-like protein
MVTIPELRKIVEKKRSRKLTPLKAAFYREPIQVLLTRLFLHLNIGQLQIGILWLIVGIVGAFFFLNGNIKYGLIAILLHYVQTILDGCDGQVARYNKRTKLSAEEDYKLAYQGLYLDRFQHIVVDILAMSFFAIGLYQISGFISVLVAGVILVIVRIYKRTHDIILYRVARILRERSEMLEQVKLKYLHTNEKSLGLRIFLHLFWWIKNGKRLYVLILIAHLLDLFFPYYFNDIIPAVTLGLNFRICLIYSFASIGIFGLFIEVLDDIKYMNGISKFEN